MIPQGQGNDEYRLRKSKMEVLSFFMNSMAFEKMNRHGATYWWYQGKKAILEHLICEYDREAGTRILDLGCGTGSMFDFLAPLGSIVGLDNSEDAIEFARQSNGAGLIRGNTEFLPFESKTFDLVASFDNLEHVENDDIALQEIRRVIVDNGLLLLSVPAHEYLWSGRDIQLGHQRRYRKEGIRKKLNENRFEVAKASYGYFCLYPVLLVKSLLDRVFNSPKIYKTDIRHLPEPLNSILAGWLKIEALWSAKIGLPAGTSIFVIARAV
jgi:SAM-dependent methyltransferase